MQEPARLWDYATEICALAWSEAVMRSGELHDLPIIGLAPRPGVTRRIVPCAHPATRARALGAKAKPCSAIGRAHVCTQVTNEHMVCTPLLEKKKKSTHT